MSGGGDPPGITSEETLGGWTNEHVREGFDVNGAESRISPMGMDRRVRLVRLGYEVLGETAEGLAASRRQLYPTIRRVARFLGREQAGEQAIAEQEYLIQEMTAEDRHGIGSKRWLVGAGYILVIWGLAAGLGMGLAAGAIFFLGPLLMTSLGFARADAIFGTSLLVILVGGSVIVWQLLNVKRSTDD